MNCSLAPLASEEPGAVIPIDVSGGLVTVSAKLFEVMPLKLALVLVLPTATAVANPVALMLVLPTATAAATPAALIVAVAGTEEAHAT